MFRKGVISCGKLGIGKADLCRGSIRVMIDMECGNDCVEAV
jgi:hypothetical protein